MSSVFNKPRLALKRQALADFLAKIPQQEMEPDSFGWWILNVDGASRQVGVRLGPQLKASIGGVIEKAIRLNFPTSKNEVEYEAIIAGIDLEISVSLEKKIIRSDSQLEVGKVNGEYEIRDTRMTKYVSLVTLQLENFVLGDWSMSQEIQRKRQTLWQPWPCPYQ